MSKLKKVAEIQQMEDGKFVDTETGEVTDYMPKEQEGVQFKEEVRKASDDYLNNEYYNQYGKVSPFNIIFKDNIGQLYGMDPKSASDAIINIIEQLNMTYANDKTYDYVSKDYLNKLKLNLSKKKTIDQIIQYMTNIYFKGIGMSDYKYAEKESKIMRRLKTTVAEYSQQIYKFEYNDRLYEFSENELYDDFLMNLDYDTVSMDDQYIEIIFENGNELKLKLL